MINLYNTGSGVLIASLTEEQLKYLIDQLEEESSTDQEYYLNTSLVDSLEEEGADKDLIAILRTALGGNEEVDIRWSRA